MAGLTQDSTLNKLILLFIFDKMEMPLSENTIIDLCKNKNNWIEYVDLKIALEQLLEANFVCKMPNGTGEPFYNITVEGRVCLAHFFVRIPSSSREMISNYIKNSRMNYRRRQEYSSKYEKCDDGTYDVTLCITDSMQVVLELKMNVPNRSTAKYIDKNWGDKAAKVYSAIYDNLVDQP
ncbi:MAG: DUF4364 family protein [Clostridia bacterium]|nr:DUF4364 family protein [Clostridia bacterium]